MEFVLKFHKSGAVKTLSMIPRMVVTVDVVLSIQIVMILLRNCLVVTHLIMMDVTSIQEFAIKYPKIGRVNIVIMHHKMDAIVIAERLILTAIK